MIGDKFTCANCGNEYEKDWSDEEAEAEATKIFGEHPESWSCGKAIVCDDCFQKMHPLKTENIDLLINTRQQL
jgi:rubredoxin